MKIIRTYILRECVLPFILSLSILTCIFLLGNLIQLTNLVVNKGVPLSTVGNVFILYIPVLLGYTLPIACLVSIIITFSRFSLDNEIMAMRACGVHLMTLLIPLTVVGIIISLFAVILNERIIPYAYHQQYRMLKTLGSNNPTALLEAGVFIHSFDSQILFINKVDGNKMYNVTIYQPQPNGPTRTIIAREGEFTPVPGKDQIKLKLINGTTDEPNFQNPDQFYKLNFDTYFITLDLSTNKKLIKKKPKAMTLNELKEEISKLQMIFVDASRLQTEYLKKITWSFASLMFILLGFPIAVITHKREKSANVVVAILCAAFYYLLSLGCEALSIKNVVAPSIIMWVPNTLTALAAIILNIKCAS